MGKVIAVCTSERKGLQKSDVGAFPLAGGGHNAQR